MKIFPVYGSVYSKFHFCVNKIYKYLVVNVISLFCDDKMVITLLQIPNIEKLVY